MLAAASLAVVPRHVLGKGYLALRDDLSKGVIVAWCM